MPRDAVRTMSWAGSTAARPRYAGATGSCCGSALVVSARAAQDLARVVEAHRALRGEQGLEPVLALDRERALKRARELVGERAGELAAYRVLMRRVRVLTLRLANPLATRWVQADPGSFITCAKTRASCAISPGNARRSWLNC